VGSPSSYEEFHAFFEQHHAELSRLARLLLGGSDSAESADDLAADALVAIWHHWDRVQAAEHPPCSTYAPPWTACRTASVPASCCGTRSTSRNEKPRVLLAYPWVR
jgi:hypothetical protein